MASVLVVALRVVEKLYPAKLGILANCYFSGDDVDRLEEGMSRDVLVLLDAGYSLLDLKNGIISSVQAEAAELGLTVAPQDIDLPSFEHGSGV